MKYSANKKSVFLRGFQMEIEDVHPLLASTRRFFCILFFPLGKISYPFIYRVRYLFFIPIG